MVGLTKKCITISKEMKKEINDNREGVFALLGSVFVLFVAMLDPMISALIAAIGLSAFAILKFLR